MVEAETGRTHVHQGPEGESWRLVRIAEPSETLTAMLVPEIAVRMAEMG